MAITKIIPIHTTIGKSVAYICNPEKTDGELFVYSERCFPKTAGAEFEFYLKNSVGNTIGRHLIQSFAPGEVTAEQAHAIGKKLADEILGGQYAYVMTTHVDKDHVHNHFVWCAVNLETQKKYVSNKKTYHKIQEISDRLCKENSLSVIQKNGNKGKSYIEYLAEKFKLTKVLDICISVSKTFGEFIAKVTDSGYEVRQGKSLAYKAVGQNNFIHSKTLGEKYSEKSIRAMIDINSEKIKSSKAYTKWAIGENLKIGSESLLAYQELGFNSLEELDEKISSCCDDFYTTKDALKATEDRISEITETLNYIRQYARTKDSYIKFKGTPDKAKEKLLRSEPSIEAHLMLHKQAKKFFNEKYGKNLPSSKTLKAELEALLPLKQKQYAEYKTLKDEFYKLNRINSNLSKVIGRNVNKKRSIER